MQLYDGKSDLYWFGKGKRTAKQMKDDAGTKLMFTEPVVLLDNGAGMIFDWRFLSALLANYSVTPTGDAEADFAELQKVCNLAVINLADRDIANALTDLGEVVSTVAMAQIELAGMLAMMGENNNG